MVEPAWRINTRTEVGMMQDIEQRVKDALERHGTDNPFPAAELCASGPQPRTWARKHARILGSYLVADYGTGDLIFTRDPDLLDAQEQRVQERWPNSATISELRAFRAEITG